MDEAHKEQQRLYWRQYRATHNLRHIQGRAYQRSKAKRYADAEKNSCVYIVYSPSDPSWIKVGQTCFPVLRMRWLKERKKKKKTTVPSDAVYYYQHHVKSTHRLALEQNFIKELKKKFKPKSNMNNNESFYIGGTDDLEAIRDLLVECDIFTTL